MFNNPVRFTDPTGMEGVDGVTDPPTKEQQAAMAKSDKENGAASEKYAVRADRINDGKSPLKSNEIQTVGNSGQGVQNGGTDPCPKCDVNVFNEGQDREPYEGFLGALEYFWTGGNEGGFRYDRNGKVLGRSPVMGLPPNFIGGPLRKGQQALKIGKYLFNPTHFHKVIKPDILNRAGNFYKIVGKNPDIGIDGTKIILKGAKNGPFKGKSFETGLSILDFIL